MAGGSKSKNKGNSFERQAAKIFSEIFGGSWQRNIAGSGNMIGGKNSFRKNIFSTNQTNSMKADIIPPDDMVHICIECKSYQDFAFHLLLTGKQTILDGWISQNDIAKNENDISLIVMKFNRIGLYIATPFKKEYVLKNYVNYHSKYGHYVFCPLEEFLKDNKEILILMKS